MAKPKKIERLFAWIATHEDGEEGVPAARTPDGPVPLVGADRARIESLRDVAYATLGMLDPLDPSHGRVVEVRLVRFEGLVEIEKHKWQGFSG